MNTRTHGRSAHAVAYVLGLIALMFLFVCAPAFADPAIFSWTDNKNHDIEDLIPNPWLDDDESFAPYDPEYFEVFDFQDSVGRPLAFTMRTNTNPLDFPSYMSDVLSHIVNNSYTLTYCMADFEIGGAEIADLDELNDVTATMVNNIRNHADSSINNAYVGNYNDWPGDHKYYEVGSMDPDRDVRNAFYLSSGLNMAMPTVYPYSNYKNHATSGDPCVSIRHALFWGPLEKLSEAKRHLPAGHLLVPWISGFTLIPNYSATPPSTDDCRARVQHFRLRGVDGFHSFGKEDNSNYASNDAFRADMLDAWHDLEANGFFDYGGTVTILNTTTNKTGGVEWSGMLRGTHAKFIFSNFTASSQVVNLPAGYGLPAQSPSISAGAHLIWDCTISSMPPVAWWKLNENSGTTAGDSAGSYPGTISGATWVAGKLGYALSFDGTNDEVAMGDVLDLGLGDRSISLWFKTTATSGCLLSKGYSTTDNAHAIYLNSGKVRCLMDLTGTDRVVESAGTVNNGQWHHMVVTIDRDGYMKLYLDGAYVTQTAISADATVNEQTPYEFYLGRNHSGTLYFAGQLDDVKVWNQVLSESDVTAQYSASAWWKLDESSGTSAADSGPSAYTGTVSGSPSRVTGKAGYAISFDGSNDMVDMGDVLDLGTGSRSIAVWVKTSATSGIILSKGYSGTSNQHAIYMSSGQVRCLMDISGTDRTVTSTAALNDNAWHHIVVTIDRSGYMKLYVDGAYDVQVSISADSAVNANNAYPFRLGQHSNNGTYFAGTLDDVRVYDRVLSSTEVTTLYNSY